MRLAEPIFAYHNWRIFYVHSVSETHLIEVYIHCPKRAELKFKLLKYFPMQLNIKLY
jgi:hypothetical protein